MHLNLLIKCNEHNADFGIKTEHIIRHMESTVQNMKYTQSHFVILLSCYSISFPHIFVLSSLSFSWCCCHFCLFVDVKLRAKCCSCIPFYISFCRRFTFQNKKLLCDVKQCDNIHVLSILDIKYSHFSASITIFLSFPHAYKIQSVFFRQRHCLCSRCKESGPPDWQLFKINNVSHWASELKTEDDDA